MFKIASLFRAPEPTTMMSFRKSQYICREGTPSDSLFYIEAGTVKLTVTSSSGKEAVIGFYDRGHLIGESALTSDHATRFHNAIAITDVRVSKIERVAALQRARSDSAVAYSLLTWSLTRNKEIQQELVEQFLISSEQRLVRILSSLAEVGAADKAQSAPRLTQQDLANGIGLSRQRVNVLMSRLKRSGVIDEDGGLTQRQPKTKSNGSNRRD